MVNREQHGDDEQRENGLVEKVLVRVREERQFQFDHLRRAQRESVRGAHGSLTQIVFRL
jgi:hypothetical protein|tara:strand:- start:1104 stop:1280 length:177 start_codon:yes stop_codon:yes gene_type:complete